MSRTYYSVDNWNLICDVCGKKIKASQSRKRWDGLIVCEDDYEFRHPQDFIKTKADKQSVPFSRPRSTDTFVEVTWALNTLTCAPLGLFGIADMGTAGCAITGRDLIGTLT